MDWDKYYSKPYKTAGFSRKITESLLIKLMQKHLKALNSLKIIELGGANSCFFDSINSAFRPEEYTIIDNNQLGLDKIKSRCKNINSLKIINENILNLQGNYYSDLTFSVGLIEHFSPADTKRVIQAHLDTLKSNGIAIISFPTPTLLYKTVRKISEIAGMWIFDDERPIVIPEVIGSVNSDKFKLLETTINWKIILTQAVVVIKKL